MNYTVAADINIIRGYYNAILKIKDDFFAALSSSNANIVPQITADGDKLFKRSIDAIYQRALDQQTNLEKERANIMDGITTLNDYKILLEYKNTRQNASPSIKEGFDNASQIMPRDLVMLYNLQYLQIFCKVLGIVIIIAIFLKYFSLITGTPMSPNIISQVVSQTIPKNAAI